VKREARYTIYDVVEHFGLVLELHHDLPDSAAGFLDRSPEPKFIAVNANLPKCEQVFTIAHELGHYVKHPDRSALRYRPWYLDRPWKSPRMIRVSMLAERYIARWFNIERQADLWALSVLLNIGAVDEMRAWLEHHPEKAALVFLVCVVAVLKAIENLVIRSIRAMLSPLQAV